MRRFAALLGLMLAMFTHAQAQDDQYVRIYNLIQEGDVHYKSARLAEALASYQEAQIALMKFQKIYPNWNTKVVSFRLNYLASRIGELSARVPATATNAPPAAAPATPAMRGTNPPPAASSELENQLRNLQEQVRRLEADKQLLEAKLREAFSVQPPTMDPRELAKAQQRILSLEKENSLLQVSVAQGQARTGFADGAAVEQLKRDLSEANQKLAEQTGKVTSLESQKQELQAKFDSLAANPPNQVALDAARQALDDANRRLAAQTDAVSRLESEKQALQARVTSLTSEPEGATAAASALEQLKRDLTEANQKLAEQAGKVNSLETQKQELQAKFDALAANPPNQSALDASRNALDDANRRLAEQTGTVSRLESESQALQSRVTSLTAESEAAAALRAENEILKRQLADAKTGTLNQPAPGTTANQTLAPLQSRLAALQSENEVLRLERIAMEQRLKQISAAPVTTTVLPTATGSAADTARIQQLERERDALAKKLDAANKELYGRKGKKAAARIDELTDELVILRSRLGVVEARQVPYTAEELALMRATPTLAVADPKAGKKSVRELPPQAKGFVVEAQRYFSAKEYDKAEDKYLQVLRQDEKNVNTLANLATIQMEMGRLDEAEKHVKQAIALQPEDAYSLAILGNLKLRQAQYDEALDALSQAAKLDPKNAQVQNFLGLTLSHKGMRIPAETALRKAIQLNPGYGEAHNNLAVVYATQQPPQVALARWHYQKALNAGHPRNPDLEKLMDEKKGTEASQ